MMIPQSPKSIDNFRNYSEVSSEGRAICGSLRHLINVEVAAVEAARLVALDVDVPVDVDGSATVPTLGARFTTGLTCGGVVCEGGGVLLP